MDKKTIAVIRNVMGTLLGEGYTNLADDLESILHREKTLEEGSMKKVTFTFDEDALEQHDRETRRELAKELRPSIQEAINLIESVYSFRQDPDDDDLRTMPFGVIDYYHMEDVLKKLREIAGEA